jgi:uncharacterized membrane protein (UPF0127 family)
MKILFTEVADDFIKREAGLMFRKKMSQNESMLFKFAYPTYASFWMKNTYIPLDIAFLDEDGRIFQIESMSPLSTRAIRSNKPCKYALEVNRGWFRNNDIKIGSCIAGEGISRAEIKVAQTSYDDEDDQDENIASPDVMLNKTFRQILQDADNRNLQLVIFYQTKWGRTLPPKIISPPFTFEADEFGTRNAIVKAWDVQDASWKSFLVDNILKLEPKDKPKVPPKKPQKPQKQKNILKQQPPVLPPKKVKNK